MGNSCWSCWNMLTIKFFTGLKVSNKKTIEQPSLVLREMVFILLMWVTETKWTLFHDWPDTIASFSEPEVNERVDISAILLHSLEQLLVVRNFAFLEGLNHLHCFVETTLPKTLIRKNEIIYQTKFFFIEMKI